MQHLFQVLKRINRYFLLAEKVLLCTLLFTMIFLSFGQIIGRKVSISFLWVGPFLKIEVLWIVFTGAALATEYGQHIKIDFLASFVQSDLKKKTVSGVAQVFAMLACFGLFLISINYMRVMSADNSSSILRGIPDWCILFIIPYSFFMMFIRSILNIRKIAARPEICKTGIGQKQSPPANAGAYQWRTSNRSTNDETSSATEKRRPL